ncbi:hypothetical protein N9H08_00560 [bacterium]|nr:hypothetical protein [bacterium]
MSHSPMLTLAIPVLGDAHLIPLRRTLDGIHRVLADEDIEVLVQVGSAAPQIQNLTSTHPQRPLCFLEEDEGIYDAMNRLAQRALGQRILFLGAGDIPLAGLSRALDRWEPDNGGLEIGGVRIPDAEPKVPRHYAPRWDSGLRWRNVCHHQGMAYPTELLREQGGFSLDYPVLGDYALSLVLWQSGVKAKWNPGEDWISAAPGGVSRQFNPALFAEERQLKAKLLQPGPAKWCQPLWIRFKSRWKGAGQ